jgi:drug/metabolite transporter (DMT)-like permease
MKMMYKGFIALAIVVIYSSLVTIALQVGGSSLGVVPLLLYSSIAGTATMLVVSYFQDRGKGFLSLLKDKKSLVILSITGIFAFAVSTLLFTWGTLGTTPSISAIVYRTYPLIIALLTPIALRQKVSRRQLLSLVIGFASVGIIISNGSLNTINFSELPYIGLVLLAALAVALTTLVIKRYNASTTGFVLLANVASTIFALIAVLIFHIAVPINLSTTSILAILVVGGFDLGIGSLFFYYTYKVFSTSLVGLATLAIPFLTVVLSFALLGTPMQPYYFVAAGLLTVGILIQGKEVVRAPEWLKEKDSAENYLTIFDVTSAFLNTKVDAIHDTMKGNGRVLAIKLKNEKYNSIKQTLDSESEKVVHKGLVYTSYDQSFVSKEESTFISDILGPEDDETVLMSAGHPVESEKFFDYIGNEMNKTNED